MYVPEAARRLKAKKKVKGPAFLFLAAWLRLSGPGLASHVVAAMIDDGTATIEHGYIVVASS
jgi:hypothetical protein